MTKQEMIENLKEKGFAHIYEWTDGPGVEYPEHVHKGKVCFYVASGSISMNISGVDTVVQAGEYIDVPVGAPHTAKVGTNGCTFIVGEEIEGDS